MFSFGGRRYGRQMCFVNYRPRSGASDSHVNNTASQEIPAQGAAGITTAPQANKVRDSGSSEKSKKHGKSQKKEKKTQDMIFRWVSLDNESQDAAMSFMRKSIMSPFLFHNKFNYSSKVSSWLQDGGILTSNLSSKDVCISEETLRIVEMMEAIINHLLSELDSLGAQLFLRKISNLGLDELSKCSSVSKVMSLCREKFKSFIADIRQCLTVHPSISEDKICLGIIVATYQATKHIKQAVGVKPTYQMKIEKQWRKKEKELEKCKVQGNDFFQRKKYDEAISAYSQALSCNPFSHILYGNRSQSFLKMVKYREALSDARRAVYLEPTWEKAHYRLAEAHRGLGQLETAVAVNKKAQEVCGRTPFLRGQEEKFLRAQAQNGSKGAATPTLASLDEVSGSSSEDEERCFCHCNHDEEEEHYYTCDSMPEQMSSDGECCPCCRATHPINCCMSPHNAAGSSSSSPPFNEDSLDLDDLDSIPSLESESDSFLEFEDDFSEGIVGDEVSLEDMEATSSSESELNYSDCSDGEMFDDSRFGDPRNVFVPPFLSPGMEILRQLSLGAFPHNFEIALEALQRLDEALQHSEGDSAPPPALPEVIESLLCSKITQEQVDSNTTCPICHCEYELNEEVTLLPCEHFYHSACITTWLKMHATCPTCRHVLPY